MTRPATDSPQVIIRSYQSFLKSIQHHGEIHSVKNRVVICPILYAPKYCDDRLPPGQNFLHKVFEVNQWIHQFNKEIGGIVIDLDCQGVFSVPSVPDQGVRHDYSKWREPRWHKMLHLGKEAQESAAAQVLQVFKSLGNLEREQISPENELIPNSSYIVEVVEEEEETEEESE